MRRILVSEEIVVSEPLEDEVKAFSVLNPRHLTQCLALGT